MNKKKNEGKLDLDVVEIVEELRNIAGRIFHGGLILQAIHNKDFKIQTLEDQIDSFIRFIYNLTEFKKHHSTLLKDKMSKSSDNFKTDSEAFLRGQMKSKSEIAFIARSFLKNFGVKKDKVKKDLSQQVQPKPNK